MYLTALCQGGLYRGGLVQKCHKVALKYSWSFNIGFAGGCYCIFIKPRSMETVVAACLGPAHVSMDTVMV